MIEARPGIFNQTPATSSVWSDRDEGVQSGVLAESTGGASEASSRSNMLAKMFQPPWDLMYKGGWDSAREEGREGLKWLLVNIQDGSVFDCQVLNRDLWKNPSVVDTVRENFIFLQYSKDDIRAEQYLQYYFQEHSNPDLYPHIAIVDPRTGEQVKVWSTEVPKPSDFLMQIHEFLDRYSLSSHARNPIAKRKSEAKKPKTIDQMTEEEQLERAMQASLAAQPENAEKTKFEDPDELTRSVGEIVGKGKSADRDPDSMSTVENGHETPSTPSPFSLIFSDRPHDEPAAGPDVTRIQFRHPAGRVIRRFATSDPVRRIFEWLKAAPLEGKEGAEFELVAMGQNLMDAADQSIEQAGLKNGTVMIEFLDG
jgi:UBX domain-containing protein 7